MYINVFLFFFTILVVEIKIILMMIIPILKHWKRLDQSNSDISNTRMISVPKRLFLTLFTFALRDVLLMVSSLVIPRINTWLPVFTIINMNINSLSIIFSFVDFKQRLIPSVINTNTGKVLHYNCICLTTFV